MASNYDYSHLMTGKSQRLGSFWVHMVFDVDEIRKGAFQSPRGIPIGTDFKIGKLKGGTIIRDSLHRITGATKGDCDYTIGTTEGGTEVAGGTALPGDTTTDWIQGTADPNSVLSLVQATEDHYIWLRTTAAIVLTGRIELLLECVAGADDNY
jgi:hypothetical protein